MRFSSNTGQTIDNSGTIVLAGGTLAASLVTVYAGGSLIGAGTVTGVVTDLGTIAASGGLLELESAVNNAGTPDVGTLEIETNATLALLGSSNTVAIGFAGADATLELAKTTKEEATLSGLAAGDRIILEKT